MGRSNRNFLSPLLGDVMRGHSSVRAWLLFACLTMAPAWGAGWALLEGGRMPVLTDASEAEARRVLAALEEMAQAMEALYGALPEEPVPVRVYLIRDAALLRRLGTQIYGKGFFQSGPDFDTIAVLAGDPDTVRSARHEYVHRALHRTARRLPAWLEEGLAEYYSVLGREGGRWLAGRPIETHVQFLRAAEWARFEQLERMHQDQSLWDRSAAVNLYYGQSWALTHYLAAGSPRADRFEALLRRLMEGEPAVAAMREEYGESPDRLLQSARRALESGRLRTRLLAAAPAATTGGVPRWRALGEDEASAALAELALARTNLAADDEWIERLARAARGSPRGQVRMAMLALRRNDRPEAERLLRAATREDVREPAAWFELAMLVRDREGATPEVRRLLEKTVALNPGHAEAWYLLAMDEQRAGRTGEAARLLERSVAALPRQFLFREALARVYAELGRAGEARAEALAARAAAANANERAMADGLLRELEQAARAAPAPEGKPEVTIPRGWLEPRRDGEVRGALVRVECGQTIFFEVQTGEGLRRLRANPARLMVTGRPQNTTFQCGPQPDRPLVTARFQSPDLLVQLLFADP